MTKKAPGRTNEVLSGKNYNPTPLFTDVDSIAHYYSAILCYQNAHVVYAGYV